MELKYDSQQTAVKAKAVLIAPLWNWNGGKGQAEHKSKRSNRTFMELKYTCEQLEAVGALF